VTPHKDEIVGDGKYLIKKGTTVVVLAGDIGRDPTVWGEDVSSMVSFMYLLLIISRPMNLNQIECWMENSRLYRCVYQIL
jgi:hypothetical protein